MFKFKLDDIVVAKPGTPLAKSYIIKDYTFKVESFWTMQGINLYNLRDISNTLIMDIPEQSLIQASTQTELFSPEEEKTMSKLSWQEAYEQNKTRDKCVLCGNKTKPKALFSSTINTCQCVDDLASGKPASSPPPKTSTKGSQKKFHLSYDDILMLLRSNIISNKLSYDDIAYLANFDPDDDLTIEWSGPFYFSQTLKKGKYLIIIKGLEITVTKND